MDLVPLRIPLYDSVGALSRVQVPQGRSTMTVVFIPQIIGNDDQSLEKSRAVFVVKIGTASQLCALLVPPR